MSIVQVISQFLSLALRFFVSKVGVAACLAIASLMIFFAPSALAGVPSIPGSTELRGVSMGAFQ